MVPRISDAFPDRQLTHPPVSVDDVLTHLDVEAYVDALEHMFGQRGSMTKRFDEEVRVERDGGMPSGFEWRGRRYRVVDVIGRWRIEGRWWEDGRDREYWRVEARGGAVWDLYHDHQRDRWHVERLWD